MTILVLNVDLLKTQHDDDVYTAFLNFSRDIVNYGTIDRSFQSNIYQVQELTKHFINFADVINWSFATINLSSRDTYDDIIREAYLKNTAITISAGNIQKDALYYYKIAPYLSMDISAPEWYMIPEEKTSPYDFTVGAIKTFDWNPEFKINDKATKLYRFELADFSFVAPRFVDFYTYGDGGTSFSAPRVAALIADIKTEHPKYDLNQIRTILERNSKSMIFERDNHKWIAQVLDPWNLETNWNRILKPGNGVDLFSNSDPPSEYTWTFDTTHVIDRTTRIDAMHEIFSGNNSTEQNIKFWTTTIDNNKWTLSQTIDKFLETIPVKYVPHEASNVPLIERVQALFHLGLNREPTLSETTMVIDYYDSVINENWQQLVVDFVAYYKPELTW